jgi:acetyl-CoA C-acetyltransferase
MMKEAVIVSVARTPITKYKGDFADFTVPELGAIPIKAVIEKTSIDPQIVDEVVMGNLFGSDWGNVSRACWLEAGYPMSTSAITVDRQCSSAVNAVGLAASMIQTGIYDVMIAGGVESYSQQPFYIQRPSKAFPDALKFIIYKVAPERYGVGSKAGDMIATAENLAKRYNLSREECDAFAMDSHLKAAKAWEKNYFADQVVTVPVPQRKGEPKMVSMDACVRSDVSMENLAKLRPIMKDGVVTAGNASPMNDGASAILMMSREKAEELGLKPLAIVREYCAAGVDPSIMGIGPVYSTRKLMLRHGYKIDDFDLVELNEAFAAQSLPCIRELGLDPSRVNVEGGAIAIGHPNGCSGGMLVARLVYALRRRNLHRGLVSFCCGGGQGFSLVIENTDA